MSIDKVERIFKQLVVGVSYLHSKNIAHRNLALENLLLDKCEILKIADFGMADMFRTDYEREKRGMTGVCGSSQYAAPEMYAGDAYDGEKVDVWSCGVILFVMMYRYFPFKEARITCKSYVYFMKRRKSDDYILARIPCEIKELVVGMLEPDPIKRIGMEDVLKNEWIQNIDLKENINV